MDTFLRRCLCVPKIRHVDPRGDEARRGFGRDREIHLPILVAHRRRVRAGIVEEGIARRLLRPAGQIIDLVHAVERRLHDAGARFAFKGQHSHGKNNMHNQTMGNHGMFGNTQGMWQRASQRNNNFQGQWQAGGGGGGGGSVGDLCVNSGVCQGVWQVAPQSEDRTSQSRATLTPHRTAKSRRSSSTLHFSNSRAADCSVPQPLQPSYRNRQPDARS
jgi:hypothetical protein